MPKKSTNFNRWRKVGHSASDVADLMTMYGVTVDDLKAYQRKQAGYSRARFTCPRCGQFVEAEVSNYDQSTTCPSCENKVTV